MACGAEGKAAAEDERLPPGFRFHPTDEELIGYYLTHKITEVNFSPRAIAEADLNKCEPWDLPGKAKMGEKEWYFFSLRDRKYPTGLRTNRATSAGYWKTTGKDKDIFSSNEEDLDQLVVIGMKKTLVFYRGRAPRGEKTNWVMHEYRLHSKSAYKGNKDGWVVCRVFVKNSCCKKLSSSQPRSSNPYHIDMASAAAVFGPSLLSTDHLSGGGNYFGSLPRFPRLSHAGVMNLSAVLPQLNYPGGGGGGGGGGRFTLSGLNLNLGAPTLPPPPQPAATVRPIPIPLTSQAQGANYCLMEVDGGGMEGMMSSSINMNNVAPRYINEGIELSAGMELDHQGSYSWPQYWKD